MIKEKHGIPDAIKIAAVSNDKQEVIVTDGAGLVHLSIGTSAYPAAMTPEQARFIAKQLNASANRVEAVP